MHDWHAEVSTNVQKYMVVFVALATLTVLTVMTSQMEFRGNWNIFIALVIAAIKGSLVAAVFMHLGWERAPAIWWPLALSVVFFLTLIFLALLTMQDMPAMTKTGTWG